MIKLHDIPASITISQTSPNTIKGYVSIRLPVKDRSTNKDFWIFKEEYSIQDSNQTMTMDYMIMMSIGAALERIGKSIKNRAIIKD